MSPHVLSNCAVAVVVLSAVALAWSVRQQPWWRDLARNLWRRRPLAVLVVGAYLLIGTLDSISWVGGGPAQGDLVAFHEPRSVIDRLFPADFHERSYSAPL